MRSSPTISCRKSGSISPKSTPTTTRPNRSRSRRYTARLSHRSQLTRPQSATDTTLHPIAPDAPQHTGRSRRPGRDSQASISSASSASLTAFRRPLASPSYASYKGPRPSQSNVCTLATPRTSTGQPSSKRSASCDHSHRSERLGGRRSPAPRAAALHRDTSHSVGGTWPPPTRACRSRTARREWLGVGGAPPRSPF